MTKMKKKKKRRENDDLIWNGRGLCIGAATIVTRVHFWTRVTITMRPISCAHLKLYII